jgi:HAMP domain-containing protein
MIERKLTAGFLLAIAIQTGGALVWAGAAAQRISALEHRVELSRPIGERLARVEAELGAMKAQLDRIEMRLERADG